MDLIGHLFQSMTKISSSLTGNSQGHTACEDIWTVKYHLKAGSSIQPPPLPTSRGSWGHRQEQQQQESGLHIAAYVRKPGAHEMYSTLYRRGWRTIGGFSCYTRSCKNHAHGHIKYLKFSTLKKTKTAPSL